MTTNLTSIKTKIIDYIKEKGPCLPVSLTKITGMNLTFTSAILSELLAERKLKISNLKIGSSPLYYLEGQEEKLENFIDNLKPVEKDAFVKLRQNKILEDDKQEPAIRVALRSLKDFAVPIKAEEKLFWKYHLLSDEKAIQAIEGEKKDVAIGQERVIGQNIWNDIKKEVSKEEVEEIVKKRVNEIIEKIKEEKLIEKAKEEIKEEKIITISPEKPKIKRKKERKTKNENQFLNEVKKVIEEKGFVFNTFLKDSKEKVILVCSKEEKKFLILAYNRKSIGEKEVLKDYRKYFQDCEKLILIKRFDKKSKIEEKKSFYNNLDEIFQLQ